MVRRRPADIHGMTPQHSFVRRYSVVATALAIAAIFIYAGVDKMHDPLQFADSIYAFAILPAVLINGLAMGLPVFEIGCGLLIFAHWTRRIGAFAVALTSLVFFLALASALLRGLTLDCGCFGSGTPSRPRMWMELGLDAILFCGSVYVYLRLLNGQLSEDRRTGPSQSDHPWNLTGRT
jgi:putative oxidoreductase